MEYVYILKCADNTYYTGHKAELQDIIRRLNKENVTYTSPRRPLTLVTYIAFSDKYSAIHFEKYLKSSSGRHSRINGWFNINRIALNKLQLFQVFLNFLNSVFRYFPHFCGRFNCRIK
jgi:putative endonuclease